MPLNTFDRLPPILAGKRLEGFDSTVSPAAAAMLEAAWQVLNGEVLNLVMVGKPGAGKSHIAAAIANAVRARQVEQYEQAVAEANAATGQRWWPVSPTRPWWVNVPLTMVRVRTFADDTVGLWLDVGSHRGLVVLDDLGRERISEFSGEQLYVAVNMRYEAGLPTIVTSNTSMRELSELGYGPIVSRITERGRMLELDSAIDYRTRAGREMAPGGGTSGAEQDRSGRERAR